jgi:hypothetical protein
MTTADILQHLRERDAQRHIPGGYELIRRNWRPAMPTTETAAPVGPVWTAATHWTSDTQHVAYACDYATGVWRMTITKRDRRTGAPTGTPRVTYHHDQAGALEFASYEDALAWLAEHPAQ